MSENPSNNNNIQRYFSGAIINENSKVRTGNISIQTSGSVPSSSPGTDVVLDTVHNKGGDVQMGDINIVRTPTGTGAGPSDPLTSASGQQTVEYYELGDVQGPERGQVFIFNYKDYSDQRKVRHGTEHDVAALERTFEALNFGVTTHHNKSKVQTEAILERGLLSICSLSTTLI